MRAAETGKSGASRANRSSVSMPRSKQGFLSASYGLRPFNDISMLMRAHLVRRRTHSSCFGYCLLHSPANAIRRRSARAACISILWTQSVFPTRAVCTIQARVLAVEIRFLADRAESSEETMRSAGIAVVPRVRGCGIGKAMRAKQIDVARENGMAGLFSETTNR
jgi:GNAT superfamily N-acetyltransferase